MNRLFFLICTFVLLFGVSINAHAIMCLSANYQEERHTTNLSRAFSEVVKLPYFQLMTESQLNEHYPKELGNVKCVACGNADSRPEVLQILKAIPFQLLYSEHRTKKDKITRCYIETDTNGVTKMLTVFVGWGGNDLVVTLFSGADIDLYRKEGDKLKDNSYEEIEEYVINFNAECPKVIGLNSEITSMSINRQYWTVRMKINTNGVGLGKDINNEDGKKRALTMLKAFEKYQISKLFNMRISIKAVITIETGESYTLMLEPNDIASILNDT